MPIPVRITETADGLLASAAVRTGPGPRRAALEKAVRDAVETALAKRRASAPTTPTLAESATAKALTELGELPNDRESQNKHAEALWGIKGATMHSPFWRA